MRVSTQKLTVAMVLKNDVVDRTGRVLVKAGATLSSRSIRGLCTWGVVAVEILADDVETAAHTDPLHKVRVQQRFNAANLEPPLMAELMNIAMERPLQIP